MGQPQVGLIINDRLDVALAVGADGVHVGQDDIPARLARDLLGPHRILGVSVKTVQQAQQAAADGADYLGAGASESRQSHFRHFTQAQTLRRSLPCRVTLCKSAWHGWIRPTQKTHESKKGEGASHGLHLLRQSCISVVLWVDSWS